MQLTMGYKWIFVISIIISNSVIFSCTSNSNNSEKMHINRAIDSIKCYCWCFSQNSCDSIVSCNTNTNVDPKSLIRSEYQNDKISDRTKLSSFENIINNSSNTEQISYGLDARFIFLVYTENKVDTLMYYSDKNYILNSKERITYQFDIIDSLSELGFFHTKCISCKH